MLVSKSTVCRMCASLSEDVCANGELTAPNTVSECWRFRHKSDELNLSTRSGESTPTAKLEGTWFNR